MGAETTSRVLVVADLHADLWPGDLGPLQHIDLENLDGLILAGDVCDDLRRHADQFLRPIRERLRPDALLGVLPGNHDHYNGPLDDEQRMRDAVETAGGTWMQRYDGIVGRTRVLACTLWTDMAGVGGLERNWIWEEMRDYREIYMVLDGKRPVFPQDTVAVHKDQLAWLTGRLALPAQRHLDRTVVITHHAPSRRALTKMRQIDYLGLAYASELDDIIEQSDIDLWLYGHSHHYTSFQIGPTTCQNVSLGYPREVVAPGPRLHDLVFDFGART